MDEAVAYGKEGGVISRYMKLRKLAKEKVVLSEISLLIRNRRRQC